MVVLRGEYSRRTFLQAVQELLASVGMPDPGTLTGADKNTAIAMGCVNRAAHMIWDWTDWHWKRAFHIFDIEALQPWYPLPEGFEEVTGEPLGPFRTHRIMYRDYNDILAAAPGYRFLPPGDTDLEMIEEMQEAEQYQGVPNVYSVVGDWLVLYPMPNADFVTSASRLVMNYIGSYRPLFGDSDVLPFPGALYSAHHFLCTGLFKQGLEYTDAAADQATGIELLKKVTARKTRYGQEQFTSLPGV